jgi:DNA-binding response OmpR family regulator
MTPEVPVQRTRIAVINDDTAFLNLLETLLQDMEGFDVLVRKEWDRAYEFVKEAKPDLVILDVVMDRQEKGWTILNLLTLDPETYAIPVIVCSAAVTSLREHDPYLQQHGIRTVVKPFDLETLLTAVRDALARS